VTPLNGARMNPSFFAAVAAGLAVPAFGLALRYRRDLNAARARQARVERHVISTQWGAVEYAERGHGDPVLVLHGIFHNCVGGLLSVRDLFPDRRVIAPSRFGYLGSSMPPNATPELRPTRSPLCSTRSTFAGSTSSACQQVPHRHCNWPCVIPKR
jgi:hypothetical protein